MARKTKPMMITSTHVDLQGDQYTPEALEEAAVLYQGQIKDITMEHDLVHPPIGFTTNPRTQRLEDGELGFFVDGYLYEDGEFEKVDDLPAQKAIDTLEVEDAPPSISVNPHQFDEGTLELFETENDQRHLEKSFHDIVNIFFMVGGFLAVFTAQTLGREYIKGFSKGLGFDADKTGQAHAQALKEKATRFMQAKFKPFNEKIARSIVENKLPHTRYRVALEFTLKNTQVFGIVEVHKDAPVLERLEEATQKLLDLALLAAQSLEFMEVDKVVYFFDFQQQHWTFVYASKSGSKVMVGAFGQAYMSEVQAKLSQGLRDL